MPNETTNNASGVRPLDTLLRSRFGGAVAIRGIRFQILYSIHRAFRFLELDPAGAVRLEGIEDVDLIGLTEGDQFIQVKT